MTSEQHITHNSSIDLFNDGSEKLPGFPGLNVRCLRHVSLRSILPNDPTIKDLIKKKEEEFSHIDLNIISTSCSESINDDNRQYLVSIVVPTHNTERYIRDTLQSIYALDYEPYELIIVDDGSQDATVDVIKLFLSERHHKLRARFVALPNFANPAIIRNFALYNLVSPHARFITFMDDDDLYAANDSLNKLINPLIKNDGYICAYGGYDYIDENGKKISGPAMLRKSARGAWEWKDQSKLTWENLATRRTGVYHLQSLAIRTPSPKMPYYRTGSDAGYFARIIRRVSEECEGELVGIYHVPEIIFHYRKRSNSISTKKQKRVINRGNLPVNTHEKLPAPMFYLECSMPEEYITQSNIIEFEIRKRVPHIYNALYLMRFRDAITLIRNTVKETNVKLSYLLRIIFKDFLASSKVSDFILFKFK